MGSDLGGAHQRGIKPTLKDFRPSSNVQIVVDVQLSSWCSGASSCWVKILVLSPTQINLNNLTKRLSKPQ